MPSPFPGMNPWLEQPDVWHDFHQQLISSVRTTLSAQIRPGYITKVDDNVYVHELPEEQRYLLGRPDVAIVEGRLSAVAVATRPATRTIPPAFGKLLPTKDRLTESFIEIRDSTYRDLITVIEVLSPTDKNNGPDREQYIAKRKILLGSGVHLVEIDLLRGGAKMPIEGLAQCDYAILVSRSYERPRVELWPLKLRQTLPQIPIPLKPEDPDATLDLQQLLHETFDAAGYADYIYQGKPRPPLHPEDESWAAEYRTEQP